MAMGYSTKLCKYVCLILFVFPSTVLAATYYLDAVNGNDDNAGGFPESAWRTISKVNSASLLPGDRLLFQRGQTFIGDLDASGDGSFDAPIIVSSFGTGMPPVLSGVTIRGDYYIVENLTVDHKKGNSDAVRVRGGKNTIFRNMEIKNGTKDGIDAADADNLLIERCHIHHFLRGSYHHQADAHGIVVTGTQGVTIRKTEIHHVSGDSFQADPNREPGNLTSDILIEDSHFWTSPLVANFNDGWRTGQRPGENAIDTKVSTLGGEKVPRVTMTLRNIVAHGWEKDSYIPNKATFNMKEKITAIFDGITVYDSEIAFRLRGKRGNANTTIRNVVIYNVEKAIRAEGNLANLVIYNATFGDKIDTVLELAGGRDGGAVSWEWRNNAFGCGPACLLFFESLSVFADHSTNLIAPLSDFQNSEQGDYRLALKASLIDKGMSLDSVLIDRDGHPRAGIFDVGAYEQGEVRPFDAASNVEAPQYRKAK